MDKSTISQWLSWAGTQAAAIFAAACAVVAAAWHALPDEVRKSVVYMAVGAALLLVLLVAFGMVGCPASVDMPVLTPTPDVTPQPEPKPAPEPDHRKKRFLREDEINLPKEETLL